MAGLTRFCTRHPDRPAVGVCVVTRRAICAECSTRYQGVNYSKEGLEQFLAEQRAGTRKGGAGLWLLVLLALALPLWLYLGWLGIEVMGQGLVDMLQIDEYFDDMSYALSGGVL